MIKVVTPESTKSYKDVKSVVKDYGMIFEIMHSEGFIDLKPSQIKELSDLEETFEQIEVFLGYAVSVDLVESVGV